jgi:hypothetical protein
MSCTTSREVALGYGKDGYLFSIHTGIVARGACLSWLSFYPEEMEVCFPPLTALDLLHKGAVDKGAVVVELGVMSNPALATIEAFVKRRKDVLVEVVESIKPSVAKIKPFFNRQRFEEDTVTGRALDGVIRYVMEEVEPAELNKQPTLFGDLLKGAFDMLGHLKVSVDCLFASSSADDTCFLISPPTSAAHAGHSDPQRKLHPVDARYDRRPEAGRRSRRGDGRRADDRGDGGRG